MRHPQHPEVSLGLSPAQCRTHIWFFIAKLCEPKASDLPLVQSPPAAMPRAAWLRLRELYQPAPARHRASGDVHREENLLLGAGLPKPKQLCSNFRSGRKSTSKQRNNPNALSTLKWYAAFFALKHKIYTLPCYNASWSLTPLTAIWPFAILELPWHLQALFSNFSVSYVSQVTEKNMAGPP